MTKQNEPSDQSINELYKQRKAQNLAPTSIKRQILASQQNSHNVEYIFKRISFVAVAASTLILLSLLIIQQSDQVPPDAQYQLVQIHSLDPSTESLSDNIKHRYAKHYREYLSQKKTYAAHHKSKAVMHLANDGWHLKNCNDEVMQISNELIAALNHMQKIDTQILHGNTVEIAFDSSGIILGISRVSDVLSC